MIISVRVQPRAKRNEVTAEDGRLRVRVTAPPEDGTANEAVVALLAKSLGVPKRSVAIVRGHRSRDKVVDVDGLSVEEVLARLSGPAP